MSVIRTLHRAFCDNALSPTELTNCFFSEIHQQNPFLNAYVSLTEETAYQQAQQAEISLQQETLPLLGGIPFALKDNISTKGLSTTCASAMLREYRPVFSASVWESLCQEQAVLLGKTNMDEFAMGSSTETSVYGPTRNPLSPQDSPGGSSGGAAAAVAAGLAVYALGSDTGGSVRQPAAYCGLTALKPTYGAVSRWGLIAYASSLDQIGPMALCAEDTALVLDVIAQKDERDDTSRGLLPTADGLSLPVAGKKGVIPVEMMQGTSESVKQAVWDTAHRLENLGVSVETVSVPHLAFAAPAYYILACAEASSNLARYDGVRYGYRSDCSGAGFHQAVCRSRWEGFGEEVRRRILMGTYVLSAGHHQQYYQKAQQVRRQLQQDFASLFSRYDFVLSPVSPTAFLPLGKVSGNPVAAYQADLCTVPANLTGLPALALPSAVYEHQHPVGVQLMGRRFEDAFLLRLAHHLEGTGTRPPLPAPLATLLNREGIA